MLPIALVGDVRKAFHQVEVCERDRDCLRFLWVEDPTDMQLKIQELRFTRVISGSGPSPFLLNGTFQKHFEKYQEVDPLFVKQVLDNLYVDDYLGGADTPSSTLELWGKLKKQMKEGGFQIHEWKTNSEKVLKSLKSEKNENGDETFAKQSLGVSEQQSKVLGIQWNPADDKLTSDLSPAAEQGSGKLTKRKMLSLLAKIFDPFCLVGPAVIQGKVAFQEACKILKEWDTEVPDEVKDRWEGWKRGIYKGSQMHGPRCIVAVKEGGIKHVMHCFADASKEAYRATVYLVCKLHYTAYSDLVAAKTRLPPIKKKMTMPRLELTAARIAVRLATSVKEALSSNVTEEFHMWSDRSTVFHWLEGKGRYKQFVEHRVREICSLMPDVSWKYCPTDENPADLGTRGKHRDNCRKVNFGGRVRHGCAQPGGLTNHTLIRCIMRDRTKRSNQCYKCRQRLSAALAWQPSSSWKNLVPGTDC